MDNILQSVRDKIKLADAGQNLESANPYNKDFQYLDFHESRWEYLFNICAQNFHPEAKFLDIGSLFGYTCVAAQIIGFQSHGLDLAKYVEEFAPRFRYLGIDNRACDLRTQDMPFSDSEFDLIIASEVLEHFNFHPAKFFSEIARVLKPGGLIIITTPNLIRLNNVIKMLLGRSVHWDIKDKYWDGVHYREFTAAEIDYLIKNSGLKIEKIAYRNFDYPNMGPMVKILNRLSGLVFPHRKGNLIVSARK